MAMRALSAPADVLAQPILLPYPSELPDGLPARPRVLQLTDADAVSRGLADGTPRDRASNREVRACLELVQATTRTIDPRARIICAASSATATRHLDVMTASGGNTWLVRRGLDGADRCRAWCRSVRRSSSSSSARSAPSRPRRTSQVFSPEAVMTSR